jgi:hypothetical protein
MKLTALKALLLPIAFLALGGINQASASPCLASYTMTAVTTSGFSCTIGDLTFSNFAALYGASGGATTPDPTVDVTVNFEEMGVGTDPFGTAASGTNPIYSVITDYVGGNSVGEFQSETGVVQYLVTDGTVGTSLIEVDGAITGVAANTASGSLNKDICSNNQFEGGATPSGICPVSDMIAASGLALTSPAGTEADGTPDFGGPFSLSSLGVYDGWSLAGGSTNVAALSDVTSVENDFIEIGATPEPGTFALLGGALVAFGVIRRRRKVA